MSSKDKGEAKKKKKELKEKQKLARKEKKKEKKEKKGNKKDSGAATPPLLQSREAPSSPAVTPLPIPQVSEPAAAPAAQQPSTSPRTTPTPASKEPETTSSTSTPGATLSPRTAAAANSSSGGSSSLSSSSSSSTTEPASPRGAPSKLGASGRVRVSHAFPTQGDDDSSIDGEKKEMKNPASYYVEGLRGPGVLDYLDRLVDELHGAPMTWLLSFVEPPAQGVSVVIDLLNDKQKKERYSYRYLQC